MRCIALDDEPIALTLLSSFVKRTPGLELTGAFTDPREALSALQGVACDLLLLDLHMPHIHGFDILKRLSDPPVAVITTAHGQHAAASYDLEVADYLMKPFTYERFLAAVERARSRHANREEASIHVRSGLDTLRVPLSEITHVEAFDDHVKVHRLGHRPLVASSTMKTMEELLPDQRFMRVHRSYIVQWTKVSVVRERRVHVPGADLPVGDTYWPAVKKRMGGLMGS